MAIPRDIEDAIKKLLPPMIVEALNAEREHCAKLAESFILYETRSPEENAIAHDIANAIRRRP